MARGFVDASAMVTLPIKFNGLLIVKPLLPATPKVMLLAPTPAVLFPRLIAVTSKMVRLLVVESPFKRLRVPPLEVVKLIAPEVLFAVDTKMVSCMVMLALLPTVRKSKAGREETELL